MTNTILRILMASALIGACSHADSRADTTAKSASANGTVASAEPTASGTPDATRPAPHDSISDLADRGRILGDANATVWVVMVSDFQCPYCKLWHDASFQQVLKTYVNTGRVRMAFLNMPLSMHPNAVPAAEAAMCASVQGKFWPMHESLFASQKQWETLPNAVPTFDSLAKAAGVTMVPWRQCVSQHQTLALIQADHDRALAGTRQNSTPAFFVGSQVLVGADADVPKAVEAALATAPGAKKPGT